VPINQKLAFAVAVANRNYQIVILKLFQHIAIRLYGVRKVYSNNVSFFAPATTLDHGPIGPTAFFGKD